MPDDPVNQYRQQRSKFWKVRETYPYPSDAVDPDDPWNGRDTFPEPDSGDPWTGHDEYDSGACGDIGGLCAPSGESLDLL